MSIPGKNIENNITRILSRDRERDQVEVEVGVRIPGDAVAHIPGGMDVHINGNLNLNLDLNGADDRLQNVINPEREIIRDRERDRERERGMNIGIGIGRMNEIDLERLPHNFALNGQRGVRAAIRWALRGRNPENNFIGDLGRERGGGERGGGGGGGGNGGVGREGEEIEQTDGILDQDQEITGEMVDAEMSRARELINEADRRIRFAEIASGRLQGEGTGEGRGAGSGTGVGGGGVRWNTDSVRYNIDSNGKISKDRNSLLRDRSEGLGSRWKSSQHLNLPINTPLNATDYPKDYIAVVLIDIVLKEVVTVLDNIAMDSINEYNKSCLDNDRVNGSRKASQKCPNQNSDNNGNAEYDNLTGIFKKKENETSKKLLSSLAINIVRTILRSTYRRLLIPNVFTVLTVHCGLRAKQAVAEALMR